MTLLVMMVVSNSWVRAATSYRLGVRWGRGGRRGGLAPKDIIYILYHSKIQMFLPCSNCVGSRGEVDKRDGSGDSAMALNGSIPARPGILAPGDTVVSLL